MQSKIEQVRSRVAQCIAQAEAQFGIKMPQINIRFDLTGRAAGMAGCSQAWGGAATGFYLRFNVQHMALGGQTWEHLLNDTVPHEVAHSVCQAFPRFGRRHDAGWRRVCLALGGNGSRCYTAEDAPEAVAAQRPFNYITTTGAQVAVSPTIHRKIQGGKVYRARQGGQLTRQCSYSTTAPSVTREVPVSSSIFASLSGLSQDHYATLPRTSEAPSASKADRLRAYLSVAKRNVGSEAKEQTIAWAMTTLGFTRGLASTYVKNNWNLC